jgi:tetratricopeptide (TPR) repeat protein
VQEEIARAVVGALRVKVLAGRATVPSVPRTASEEAYQAYLLGRHFANGFSGDAQARAIAAFEKAVRLDPSYAPAWAGLARARGTMGVLGATPWSDARRLGLAAAERAVALDPGLPEALSARAVARLFEWDWAGARADAEKAMELDPDDPRALRIMAGVVARVRLDDAIDMTRRSLAVEPLSGGAWNNLAVLYWRADRFEEADRAFARALEVDPANAFAVANRGKMLVDAGRPSEALAVCRAAGPADPGRPECEAVACHALGDAACAEKALGVLLAEPHGDRLAQIARVQACLGRTDAAFAYLERARLDHVRLLPEILGDRCVRSLAADPRLAKLRRSMNLPPD